MFEILILFQMLPTAGLVLTLCRFSCCKSSSYIAEGKRYGLCFILNPRVHILKSLQRFYTISAQDFLNIVSKGRRKEVATISING